MVGILISMKIASQLASCKELSPMSETEGLSVAIGISRMLLRILGIWPNSGRKENLLSYFHFFVPAFVMFFFVNVPQTVLVTKVSDDLNTALEILTTFDIPIGVALFKTLGLWYNRNVLGQLIDLMAEDWKNIRKQEDLQTMWKNAKLSRLMSIIIISLAEGTIITFAVVSFFNKLKKQKENSNNATESFRPLYFNAKFFYDAQKSPQYEVTCIFQCFSTIFAASAFSSIDAFFAVLVLHVCGQLKNLRERLKRLPKDVIVGSEGFIQTLSSIVTRHEFLNRFASAIEDAFNIIFLVQMVASSVVLCLQGYQLVMITTSGDGIPLIELLFMLYFTSCFAFSLFVYCYVAEILRVESIAVGDAAYESDWYDLPSIETKLLIVTMIRAKQPFEITAGKFAAFSLNLYCSILKSSGGYLSMLLAMKDRLSN